jgi:hypothetical protein
MVEFSMAQNGAGMSSLMPELTGARSASGLNAMLGPTTTEHTEPKRKSLGKTQGKPKSQAVKKTVAAPRANA